MIRLALILLLLLWLPGTPGVKEEHKEKISKTLNFDVASKQNLLIIKNINGSILVEGTQTSFGGC